MKTLKQILSTLALITVPASIQALSPVSTYTFVDPCQPFTSITSIPATNYCYSFSVTNASASDPDSYYTWHFGNGQTAQGKSLYYCYPAASTGGSQYVISVTNNAPGCANNGAYTVYTLTLLPPVVDNCAYDATVTLNAPSVTVCCGVAIPEISYTHDYGDGTTGERTGIHTYTACGSYIMKRKRNDMSTPSPSGDCYNFVAVNIPCAVVPTGTQKNTGTGRLNIFPNPAGDMLNISAELPLKETRVFDLLGRETLHTKISTGSTVDIKSLAPGTYFLLIELENGSQKNMKFIKQ